MSTDRAFHQDRTTTEEALALVEEWAPPKGCVMKNAVNVGDCNRRGSPLGMIGPTLFSALKVKTSIFNLIWIGNQCSCQSIGCMC